MYISTPLFAFALAGGLLAKCPVHTPMLELVGGLGHWRMDWTIGQWSPLANGLEQMQNTLLLKELQDT
jgi:hypothetical protein